MFLFLFLLLIDCLRFIMINELSFGEFSSRRGGIVDDFLFPSITHRTFEYDDLIKGENDSMEFLKTPPNRSVVYIHEPSVALHHYGPGHPMKPYRLALTHDLILSYGLHERMKVYRGSKASVEQLTKFHAEDYISFLRKLTPDNVRLEIQKWGARFNIGDDCPVFDGLFDFCATSAGSSLLAAAHLARGSASIAINWSGGLHHAKRGEASGFCYVNDIVLAILELLRFFPRVLYIDIDVHHGDGVQEAFYVSDRVMTLSFHKFGDSFFPGTGSLEEQGARRGSKFSLNVPLGDGIDDASYAYVFEPIVRAVISSFSPSVIILQCGADSLGGDRLGCFNLSITGHGSCVSFVKSFNIPLLILGGGGYTIKNVSRCWAYETGLLVDSFLPHEIPESTVHRDYFSPEYSLFPEVSSSITNTNTREYLDSVIAFITEQLRPIKGAPSVQMQDIPFDGDAILSSDDDGDGDEVEN